MRRSGQPGRGGGRVGGGALAEQAYRSRRPSGHGASQEVWRGATGQPARGRGGEQQEHAEPLARGARGGEQAARTAGRDGEQGSGNKTPVPGHAHVQAGHRVAPLRERRGEMENAVAPAQGPRGGEQAARTAWRDGEQANTKKTPTPVRGRAHVQAEHRESPFRERRGEAEHTVLAARGRGGALTDRTTERGCGGVQTGRTNPPAPRGSSIQTAHTNAPAAGRGGARREQGRGRRPSGPGASSSAAATAPNAPMNTSNPTAQGYKNFFAEYVLLNLLTYLFEKFPS